LRGLLLSESKGERKERERKEKVKGTEGEMKWREGIGSPKNFGVAPPLYPDS